MFTWIYSGETTTRRIRERYLRAVMRQNIAYFDRVGAGAITTRIETDTHLIQEGISEKVRRLFLPHSPARLGPSWLTLSSNRAAGRHQRPVHRHLHQRLRHRHHPQLAVRPSPIVLLVHALTPPAHAPPPSSPSFAASSRPTLRTHFFMNRSLALVVSVIIPCIGIAGGAMNSFISKYKAQQLEATAQASTLAEEVISSVRIAHAFGNQQRLADSYDESNQETLRVGLKSARFNGLGLGVFFFIIYASYGLAFYYGTTLILVRRQELAADSSPTVTSARD